jgi:hypothetical protein
MAVLLPPNKAPWDGSLVFIGGPIQNAPAWHEKAINILENSIPGVTVACPKRHTDTKDTKKDFSQDMYNEQVDWETYYLNSSYMMGGILFWLPCSETKSERPYGQTTRFELGEWKTKFQINPFPFSVGIEPGFPNERYLRRRLQQDCEPFGLTVKNSLKETCMDMADKIKVKFGG